jgi:hypothetical protein
LSGFPFFLYSVVSVVGWIEHRGQPRQQWKGAVEDIEAIIKRKDKKPGTSSGTWSQSQSSSAYALLNSYSVLFVVLFLLL